MTRVISEEVGRIYDRHHRVEPCDIGKSCSGLIAEGECGSHRQWFGDPSTLYEQVVEPSLRCQAANLAKKIVPQRAAYAAVAEFDQRFVGARKIGTAVANEIGVDVDLAHVI